VDLRRQRPRIADVARAAGVSKTAVSFAFNSPERLSAETASRIRSVADGLGYRPHPVARLLTQQRTMTIGVLTPQAMAVIFSNPFFAVFLEGVAEAAEERGYALYIISPLHGSLAQAVARATVDGVVAIGLSGDHPEVEQIRANGLPMVLVDSDDLAGLSSIVVDDELGARAAAAHLLGLGHRDILVMAVEGPILETGDQRRTGVTERRVRGYRAAFDEAGVAFADDAIVAARASIDAGAAAFHGAWTSGRRPTAVLAMSDAIAIGAMRAAGELGLRVPDDVSVVGYDDIDLAALVAPPLTTVHQPVRRKGIDAVRLLLAEVEADPPARPEHLRLETRLVVRGSTAPQSNPPSTVPVG
jgi:DNA-binding LacI/PurR family transcriptional regulator